MEFGASQAAVGVLVLLAIAVVWLASRLKQKNRQLRRALAELQRRTRESHVAPKLEPTPVVASARSAPIVVPEPESPAMADAFLWEHLVDAFLWKHLPHYDTPTPAQKFTPVDSLSIPTGLSDKALLQPLLETDQPFIGLVVLVGIDNRRARRQEHPAESFIEALLGPADFACWNSDDEILIICPGLRGAEAQRRLNEISERLWNFQLRGQGSFSVLFSWGGIGAVNEPLSAAIASATERMQQTKRSRVLLFTRKAG